MGYNAFPMRWLRITFAVLCFFAGVTCLSFFYWTGSGVEGLWLIALGVILLAFSFTVGKAGGLARKTR